MTIYTRDDGIIAWESCRDEDTGTPTLEVSGQHLKHLSKPRRAACERRVPGGSDGGASPGGGGLGARPTGSREAAAVLGGKAAHMAKSRSRGDVDNPLSRRRRRQPLAHAVKSDVAPVAHRTGIPSRLSTIRRRSKSGTRVHGHSLAARLERDYPGRRTRDP
jgi:hypothetical protein